MTVLNSVPNVDLDTLREEVSKEYAVVATQPQKGFHFHTGRRLAEKLGYRAAQIDGVSTGALESFADTGNPFSVGALKPSERVVDLGSGAGFDSRIAAAMVGVSGRVVGVDLDEEALALAKRNEKLNRASIEWVHEDIFHYLKRQRHAVEPFEVIIIDPPKWARERDRFEEAERRYLDVNKLAMQAIAH